MELAPAAGYGAAVDAGDANGSSVSKGDYAAAS